jgi:hypothetical protein
MNKQGRYTFLLSSLLVLASCLMSVLSTAQIQNGQFTGVITDPSVGTACFSGDVDSTHASQSHYKKSRF